MAIFKYFSKEKHALAFIKKGVMLLRPLSYFRTREDDGVRGDARDGVLVYAPTEGLVITKQDGTVITLEGRAFTSSAQQDDIFVYCASNRLSAELAERFESPFCVEIKDQERLAVRLRRRAHPKSQLDYEQLISRSVDYRASDKKPEADWALPEKVAFIKPERFAWQDEYRIAIGKRRAFDIERVVCGIESALTRSPERTAAQPTITIGLGGLDELAVLHRF